MRIATLAIIVSLACALGCETKPKTDAPPPQEGGGIEVQAPGVDVKVDKEGVDVKAPGADVEARPGDADVKVDADKPN
jgi:hypothetical protein